MTCKDLFRFHLGFVLVVIGFRYVLYRFHIGMISEVGGVRVQRPQPGNRFVSLLRASGRVLGTRSATVT